MRAGLCKIASSQCRGITVIRKLHPHIAEPDWQEYGRLVGDLAVLQSTGLPVLDSLAVSPDVFLTWQSEGRVPGTVIDGVLEWAHVSKGAQAEVLVRPSLKVELPGLDDKLKSERTFASIRFTIERIYRSWGSDRSRAARVIAGVKDESNVPAILVQPVVSPIWSLITHHAILSEQTDEANYTDNVNNTIPFFVPGLSLLIERTEGALKRPAKIYFTSDDKLDGCRIVSVSDEIMTTDARWRFSLHLFNRKQITDVQFLQSIEPSMLGYADGLEFDPKSNPTLLQGQPASSGFARGEVVFRGVAFKSRLKNRNLIFVTTEATREDIPLIEMSVGTVGTRGGMTSHLAVISRGMRKPAVTGCDGTLDLQTRTYRTPNGIVVSEFTGAMVDGSTGTVSFSNGLVRTRWTKTDGAVELRSHLSRLLANISEARFHQFSVEEQLHLARLKSRLRELETGL
jgi:phosphohistidine swiveling domain-containing protein